MKTAVTSNAEFAPLFDWTPPPRRKLSIASFIVASIALHALCFYLFQVVYPPTVALLPPPARVTVITPDSDEGRLLLRWIEAEDPAVLSTTQRPPDAVTVPLPNAVHIPSYAGRIPELRMPSLEPTVPPIPSAQPPGPVAVPTPTTRRPQTVAIAATTLHFGSETDGRGVPTLPPLKFTASRVDVPAAAEFRVAIAAAGTVPYCFLQNSSGDAALDAQARTAIIATRFPPLQADSAAGEDQLLWTTVSVYWGNDLTLPAPPSGASATP